MMAHRSVAGHGRIVGFDSPHRLTKCLFNDDDMEGMPDLRPQKFVVSKTCLNDSFNCSLMSNGIALFLVDTGRKYR